jgi:phosphate/sulfate permease
MEPVLRNRRTDIRSVSFWRTVFITLNDRLIAIKFASVLHLPTSFTHVIILCNCHCFEVKMYGKVLFKKLIVTWLFNKLPVAYRN